MKENKELALLREFFVEWCKHEELVEQENNSKSYKEAEHLYPLLDAFGPRIEKLRKQILKAQATISVVRGKNKKTKKSASSQRKK